MTAPDAIAKVMREHDSFVFWLGFAFGAFAGWGVITLALQMLGVAP